QSTLTPPSAITPQVFCDGALISNLQAAGVGIEWYDASGNLLSPNTPLIDGTVYYAIQNLGNCKSATSTAVTVKIDNNIILDAPRIASPQQICGNATLADIATNGNTNIVWYDLAVGGNEIPLTTTLIDGASYYAATTGGGSCVSSSRTEVMIIITDTLPDAPLLVSPQYFCDGATLSNIHVPNNQIVWYAHPTGGTALPPSTLLKDKTTYYAAQKAGTCESAIRTGVVVETTGFLPPKAPEKQTMCNGNAVTLADLRIAGAGIVWYDAPTGGNKLPPTTLLVNGTTYYAAQSSKNCESDRTAILVTSDCYTIYGTIFPFVLEDDNVFNELFRTTIKLHAVPTNTSDPVGEVVEASPLYITKAVHYDGTFYIPGTPKYPGTIGKTNNPGLPINWSVYGRDTGTVDNTPVTGVGDVPASTVGMYMFKDVAPGDYILEITRQGYLTRLGKITVNADGTLGHREILAGDVNADFEINSRDVSQYNAKVSVYRATPYSPVYDFNGNAYINSEDRIIMLFGLNLVLEIYGETYDWIYSY
ncbi:MAG: hypothetical protein LBH82_06350, partial [Bacteroidales bacterium]|nr:hypothetical protein [Bacteroidales bacterium]